MDAPSHDGFDEGSTVLVFHPSLAFKEAASVGTKGHGLVLKVTLSSLITNGTIQRVVEEKELQNSLPGLFDQGGVGEDLHSLHGGHGTGRHRFGGLEDFHQAHPTVSSDRESLVVAESRDLDPQALTGLKDSGSPLDVDVHAVDNNFDHDLEGSEEEEAG
jgi:hypothetical protein